MLGLGEEYKKSLQQRYANLDIDYGMFALRYRQCRLDECEQTCCSIGAYVQPEEEKAIRRLINEKQSINDCSHPEHAFTEGFYHKNMRQTALKEHGYQTPRNREIGFHTRCVFREKDGKCSLQRISIEEKLHKWHHKPLECWLFPVVLYHEDGVSRLSICSSANNIYLHEEFPPVGAFSCAMPDPEGVPGYKVFEEELVTLSTLLDKDIYSMIKNHCLSL